MCARNVSVTSVGDIKKGITSFFHVGSDHQITYQKHTIKSFDDFAESRLSKDIMLVLHPTIVFSNDDQSVKFLILFKATNVYERIMVGYIDSDIELSYAYLVVFDLKNHKILH